MSEHRWKNTGASFQRDDGTYVERGGVFTSPSSHPDVVRRVRKLRQLDDSPPLPPQPVIVEPEPEPDTDDTDDADGPEESDDADDYRFQGIDFGSDVAYELARDSELQAADFDGRTGSGQAGAFLTDDVRAILDERGS